MNTAYVIFREDNNTHQEIYVDAEQTAGSTIVESTNERGDAMEFDTAREAYDWAGERNLDFWHVGAR